MRSISFGSTEGLLDEKTLSLFLEESKKGLEGRTKYAYEIIEASKRNGIRDTDSFNLLGYEYVIANTKKIKRSARDRNKVSMTTLYSEEGGVTEDYVSSVSLVEDAYEELLLTDELRYSIDLINRSRADVMVKYRFDIISVLFRASEGVRESVALLQKLCGENEDMSSAIWSVLSSGHRLAELFVV